jgi:hypothetical protein
MEVLNDPAEARRWCEAVGLPDMSVSYLLDHLQRCETLARAYPEAWRAEQSFFLTTLWNLTPDEVAKVKDILHRASPLPFGGALLQSEAHYSAWLWNMFARQSALPG